MKSKSLNKISYCIYRIHQSCSPNRPKLVRLLLNTLSGPLVYKIKFPPDPSNVYVRIGCSICIFNHRTRLPTDTAIAALHQLYDELVYFGHIPFISYVCGVNSVVREVFGLHYPIFGYLSYGNRNDAVAAMGGIKRLFKFPRPHICEFMGVKMPLVSLISPERIIYPGHWPEFMLAYTKHKVGLLCKSYATRVEFYEPNSFMVDPSTLISLADGVELIYHTKRDAKVS